MSLACHSQEILIVLLLHHPTQIDLPQLPQPSRINVLLLMR